MMFVTLLTFSYTKLVRESYIWLFLMLENRSTIICRNTQLIQRRANMYQKANYRHDRRPNYGLQSRLWSMLCAYFWFLYRLRTGSERCEFLLEDSESWLRYYPYFSRINSGRNISRYYPDYSGLGQFLLSRVNPLSRIIPNNSLNRNTLNVLITPCDCLLLLHISLIQWLNLSVLKSKALCAFGKNY